MSLMYDSVHHTELTSFNAVDPLLTTTRTCCVWLLGVWTTHFVPGNNCMQERQLALLVGSTSLSDIEWKTL